MPTNNDVVANQSKESSDTKPDVGLLDLLLLGAPDGKTELLDGRVLRIYIAKSEEESKYLFGRFAREICAYIGSDPGTRTVDGRTQLETGRFHLTREERRIDLEIDIDS